MDGEYSNKGIFDEGIELLDVDISPQIETTIIEPTVGMLFDNVEELFQFFKDYARYTGFPLVKKSNKKTGDGKLRSVTFACGRGGKSESLTSTRIDCKVRLTSSLNREGKWRINVLVLEHNHGLSSNKSRFFRCYRNINKNVRRELEINDIARINPKKSHNSFVVQAGDQENSSFLEKDNRNCIGNARELRLGEGDVIAIQKYFIKMQAQNSNFFYSMELDKESRLRNVFWADGRSREAYKEFGDVVTFDTTYLTKKYEIPFAPFVGVNHHGQSILLGCALISNKDTETFVWLFSTWLACMWDCAPKGIITDQDRAMQNAIEVVFPNTRHRWCLWHVMKKLPEKFGYHKQYDKVYSKLKSCVYDTQTPEEFDESWSEMLNMFDFYENEWLNGLYRDRHRWVPCCLKNDFWAGMSSTQRSESMNTFFDGFVHVKTTLKQFIEQYSYALHSKIENEFQADFKSFSQVVRCVTTYNIEKQVQSVYTIKKFKEFQEELISKMYCDVLDMQERDLIFEYVIQEDVAIEDDYRKLMRFEVIFQKEGCEVSCSCSRFESKGILCRHALFVLLRHHVKVLPDKYILSRWRKDVVRSHMRMRVNCDGSHPTLEQLEYERMCSDFAKLADLAADDPHSRTYVINWIETETSKLYAKKFKCGNNATPTTS